MEKQVAVSKCIAVKLIFKRGKSEWKLCDKWQGRMDYLDSVHGQDEFIGKFCRRFQIEKRLFIVRDSYGSVSNFLTRQQLTVDFSVLWEATNWILSLSRLWPMIFRALRISASCFGASETLD